MRWIIVLLLLALVACGTPADDTLAVAESWSKATEDLDLDATMALFADEGVALSDPHFAADLVDKSTIANAYENLFSLPQVSLVNAPPVVADDGSTVTIAWVWSGSDPATGEHYSIDGVTELVVADGRIVSEKSTYDTTDSPF